MTFLIDRYADVVGKLQDGGAKLASVLIGEVSNEARFRINLPVDAKDRVDEGLGLQDRIAKVVYCALQTLELEQTSLSL